MTLRNYYYYFIGATSHEQAFCLQEEIYMVNYKIKCCVKKFGIVSNVLATSVLLKHLPFVLVPTTTICLLTFLVYCDIPDRGYIILCLIDLPFMLHRNRKVGQGTDKSIACCRSQ